MATIASSFLTLASVTSPPTLTTTFSPSDFCTNDIHRVNDTQYEGFFFDHLGPLTSTSACFPSSWEPGTSVYFSPGLCPAGYETACSSLVSLGSVTETRATCCPQGYGCQTGTDFPWYETDICSMLSQVSGVFVYTTSTPGLAPVTVTETGRYGFNAYGVEIRWRSADFVSETSMSFSPSATITSSSSSSTKILVTLSLPTPGERGPTTVPAGSSTSQNIGMTREAIIGIGVGVAVGGVLIIAAVTYLWLRRRRTPLIPTMHNQHEPPAQAVPRQLWTQVPELDSR